MVTRWRGAQVAPNLTPNDGPDLAFAGANLQRYQYNLKWVDISDEYYTHCRGKTILNVHATPDTSPEYMAEAWLNLARAYRTNNDVLAYGILNEPNMNQANTRALMKACIEAIRSEDQHKKIIVTSPHSDPIQFRGMKTYDDDNLWYEVHMYLPMQFTHQGVDPRYPPGKKYPTANVDKERLKQYLRYVRAFQLKHNVRIYCGEFGVSTFADEDSRRNYMKACIEIFESYGWNWTAHAWREADVWNLETQKVFTLLKNNWAKNG